MRPHSWRKLAEQVRPERVAWPVATSDGLQQTGEHLADRVVGIGTVAEQRAGVASCGVLVAGVELAVRRLIAVTDPRQQFVAELIRARPVLIDRHCPQPFLGSPQACWSATPAAPTRETR